MSTDVLVRATPEMIHNWGWILVFGIILLLLGIVAIARSRAATVVSMVFFGWLLLFAGCMELVVAFMVGHWAGFFTHLLIAILFGVTGALMVFRPTISAEAVTLVMSVFFLIGGIFQLFASFWTRVPGWGWEALNGLCRLFSDFCSCRNGRYPVSG